MTSQIAMSGVMYIFTAFSLGSTHDLPWCLVKFQDPNRPIPFETRCHYHSKFGHDLTGTTDPRRSSEDQQAIIQNRMQTRKGSFFF